MNDSASWLQPKVRRGVGHRFDHLASHLGYDGTERLLGMPGLPDFMLAPLPVKPKHRNAPTVHSGRIYLAVGVRIRDHLAPHGEPNRRAVVTAIVPLELQTVPATGWVLV